MSGLEPLILGLFTGGGAAAGGAAAGAGLSLGQTLALVGTGVSAVGTLAAGHHAKETAEYQAEVAEQRADEARASSQRAAEARRREVALIQSRQRTAVAAGGGGIGDASVLDMMSDTAAAGDLAARMELYKGEQQGRGYEDAARMAAFDADNAMSAAYIGAAGNLFSGVSSMYSRFGQQHRRNAPAPSFRLPYG